jgi:predicted nucleotidyltransferase component of viral defense system
MNNIFDQMVAKYTIVTHHDQLNAYQKVMQEITLSALQRAGFFNNAAFYGGTCLRVFHQLPRFSEDMDFSLLEETKGFTLEPYFDAIVNEFKGLGREVTINRKNKKNFTHVESAFLKDATEIYTVAFKTEKTVKIKIEVDVSPPLKFDTENKLLLLPASFMTRCFTLPNLYAGKMHAMVFRAWKSRVKGRDWYDFEWYVRKGVKLNFVHLKERALQKGYEGEVDFTPEIFKELLKTKISETPIERVKADVMPFIKNYGDMEIWSTDYFLQLADMIQFES